MGWFTAIGFVMKLVYPPVKAIIKIVGADGYGYIADRVDDADVMDLSGLEKRTKVFADATAWLKNKGVTDIGLFGSSAIFILIEIAVLNLKKKK